MPDADGITFRRMTEDDLPMLHGWLNNPDVAKWYGLAIGNVRNPTLEQVVAHYAPRTRGESPTTPYLMLLGGEPFGYIQAYRLGDYPDYAATLDIGDDEAIGIDLLIGEDAYRNRGVGAAALRRFLADEAFKRPGATRAVIAPDQENVRGIRCYEKAGFRHLKTVFIAESGEHEYVMLQTRAEFEARGS